MRNATAWYAYRMGLIQVDRDPESPRGSLEGNEAAINPSGEDTELSGDHHRLMDNDQGDQDQIHELQDDLIDGDPFEVFRESSYRHQASPHATNYDIVNDATLESNYDSQLERCGSESNHCATSAWVSPQRLRRLCCWRCAHYDMILTWYQSDIILQCFQDVFQTFDKKHSRMMCAPKTRIKQKRHDAQMHKITENLAVLIELRRWIIDLAVNFALLYWGNVQEKANRRDIFEHIGNCWTELQPGGISRKQQLCLTLQREIINSTTIKQPEFLCNGSRKPHPTIRICFPRTIIIVF